MPKKGHKQTSEHRANIAAARRGRTHTEKTKRAISAAMVASHRERADDRARRRALELEEWRRQVVEEQEQAEVEQYARQAYDRLVAEYGKDALRGMTGREARVRYELLVRAGPLDTVNSDE
jgi:hypothetical protein